MLRVASKGSVAKGLNKRPITLPYESDDQHVRIRIRQLSSDFKTVETNIGLRILWGTDARVYITLEPKWHGKVSFYNFAYRYEVVSFT